MSLSDAQHESSEESKETRNRISTAEIIRLLNTGITEDARAEVESKVLHHLYKRRRCSFTDLWTLLANVRKNDLREILQAMCQRNDISQVLTWTQQLPQEDDTLPEGSWTWNGDKIVLSTGSNQSTSERSTLVKGSENELSLPTPMLKKVPSSTVEKKESSQPAPMASATVEGTSDGEPSQTPTPTASLQQVKERCPSQPSITLSNNQNLPRESAHSHDMQSPHEQYATEFNHDLYESDYRFHCADAPKDPPASLPPQKEPSEQDEESSAEEYPIVLYKLSPDMDQQQQQVHSHRHAVFMVDSSRRRAVLDAKDHGNHWLKQGWLARAWLEYSKGLWVGEGCVSVHGGIGCTCGVREATELKEDETVPGHLLQHATPVPENLRAYCWYNRAVCLLRVGAYFRKTGSKSDSSKIGESAGGDWLTQARGRMASSDPDLPKDISALVARIPSPDREFVQRYRQTKDALQERFGTMTDEDGTGEGTPPQGSPKRRKPRSKGQRRFALLYCDDWRTHDYFYAAVIDAVTALCLSPTHLKAYLALARSLHHLGLSGGLAEDACGLAARLDVDALSVSQALQAVQPFNQDVAAILRRILCYFSQKDGSPVGKTVTGTDTFRCVPGSSRRFIVDALRHIDQNLILWPPQSSPSRMKKCTQNDTDRKTAQATAETLRQTFGGIGLPGLRVLVVAWRRYWTRLFGPKQLEQKEHVEWGDADDDAELLGSAKPQLLRDEGLPLLRGVCDRLRRKCDEWDKYT